TGGGSLGAIRVGMLRVLLSSGVQPDFVVGASVGALNAGYFAGAPSAQGVATLERIWSRLRRSDIFPFALASAFGLLRHPGNVGAPVGLRRVIETNLPYTRGAPPRSAKRRRAPGPGAGAHRPRGAQAGATHRNAGRPGAAGQREPARPCAAASNGVVH